MPRTAVRTVHVSRDTVERCLTLFGTIKNASRQLGLEHSMPYLTIYSAFQHLAVRPEHKELIESAWARWQALFLRPEVPVTDDLSLNDDNKDQAPEWFPRRGKKAAV